MQNKEVVYALFIGLVILVVALITDTMLAYSQLDSQNSEKPANKKQFFGCRVVIETIHCEPLRNIILNAFNGTARIIYDPSQSISGGGSVSGSISVEPRVQSEPGVPNKEWQFVAVTWDGTSLKLYRNGILVDSSMRVGSLVEPVLAQIGSGEQQSTRSNYWRGDMDEIRIYNRALTENEIIEIFTKSRDISDGIFGIWTFDGNTNDISGNNNHGIYQMNKPEYVDGIIGKALRFDGNSRVDLPRLPSFSSALSFTAWVKPDTGTLDHAREIFNNNQFFIRVDPQLEAPNRFAAFVKLISDKPNVYAYSYTGLLASMAFAPDGRLFFTEKNTGDVRIMKDDKVLEIPFVSIPRIYAKGESGLLGLALDPDFHENHFLYLYHTYVDEKTRQPFNRIVRFTDENNRGTDMKILLDKIPANEKGTHSGGALAFGPDEKLYITVGDNLKPEIAQDPSILSGKILRINRDGTIPQDNPWLWDNNPSRIYSNEILDENVICESYDSIFCNFSIHNPANNTFFLEKDSKVKQTNQTSIKLTINNPLSDVSLYRDYRKDIGGFMLESERDWSQQTYLTLWINGSDDSSVLGIKLRDSNWADQDEEYLILNNFTGWKSFMIPLKDTYPSINFSSVRGVEFVFHKGWNTTINLDAVYLTNSSDPFAERHKYSHVSPVYSIGHRNMFGIAFDNDGIGIVTENGLNNYDEVNKIQKGGNYGWPTHQLPNADPELSTSSIKPLTSYLNIIAPAQAIYYDGDKIPELRGKFLFTSYVNSNLHALRFDDDNREIVYEEVINANHTGPAISLAKSPDGYIYYGGSAIYKLVGVDITYGSQFKHPIEITGQVDVRDLQLYDGKNQMVIDITTQDSQSFVSIKIPKMLLDGILEVSDEEKLVDFTVDDSSPDHNIVNVHILSDGDSRLVIRGTKVIPEFSISIIVMLTLFSFVVGLNVLKRKN